MPLASWVLTSPSKVRADVIRQLHERHEGHEIADLLIFLEDWEWAAPRLDRQLAMRGRYDFRSISSDRCTRSGFLEISSQRFRLDIR